MLIGRFLRSKSFGGNWVNSVVLASGIQYVHDVLIALKRVNVERHIDVDRDVGSALAVAKKCWAEKKSHEPQVFHFFAHHFSAPLSLLTKCGSFYELHFRRSA